jgi:hypothetical protein
MNYLLPELVLRHHPRPSSREVAAEIIRHLVAFVAAGAVLLALAWGFA